MKDSINRISVQHATHTYVSGIESSKSNVIAKIVAVFMVINQLDGNICI